MLRIAISCGEGFSSGFLARHLNEAAEKEHLEEAVQFRFIPFYELADRQDEIDIAMIMPHIEPKARKDEKRFSIPLYVIPYKVVVQPKARDFLEDAEDILAMAHGRGGLFAFPGETMTRNISRMQSYRSLMKKTEYEKEV